MEKFKLTAIWRYEKQILKHATLKQETFYSFAFVFTGQGSIMKPESS